MPSLPVKWVIAMKKPFAVPMAAAALVAQFVFIATAAAAELKVLSFMGIRPVLIEIKENPMRHEASKRSVKTTGYRPTCRRIASRTIRVVPLPSAMDAPDPSWLPVPVDELEGDTDIVAPMMGAKLKEDLLYQIGMAGRRRQA